MEKNLKPAVFLDRDGVICEFVHELSKIEEFKLRPGIGEAIHLLNKQGFLVFVATNQPNIAKAKMSVAELDQIHEKMKSQLQQHSASLEHIFYCPHRTAEGGGVVKEYVLDCDCRKPKSGMLKKAYQMKPFDISKSFMIGDTWRDVGCATEFGIPCLGLTGGAGFPYEKSSSESKYQPLKIFSNPLAAVQWWLSQS